MDDSISNDLETVINETYNYVNNILFNPGVTIILVIVLGLYIIMSLGSNVSTNETYGSSSNIITTILIIMFVSLLLMKVLEYFFGINIFTKITNIFTPNPELDIIIDTKNVVEPVPEILIKKQVFNIPGNDYVYQDAKALCKAYGARLATYDEIEETYKDGGEWCNYGWSEGQMVLFPTQKKTYDELQKIKGHENDCGRQGINGGYIDNPELKFGVNCYGNKPRMTAIEEDLMATKPIYPKTEKDILMEKRVNYWKNKLSEILVSPFNHNSWSRL